MKILQQGGGGREYALAKIFAEHGHTVVGCPGNDAFRLKGIGDTHPYQGPEAFAAYFEADGFDLAIAGSEDPLAAGLGDVMHDRELPFFGPRRPHARAESDKAYFQRLLDGRPIMCPGVVCYTRQEAHHLVDDDPTGTAYVIKAAGLHGGKGVWVPDNLEEAHQYVDRAAALGEPIVLQRRMIGDGLNGGEFSTVTILGYGDHGDRARNLPSSIDNKQVGANQFGLDPRMNTGGMGGDSPHPDMDVLEFDRLLDSHTSVLVRVLENDANIGPAVGFIYNGMRCQQNLGGEPVRFQESNFGRLGDPEAQYLLSRLRSDLAVYLHHAVRGTLHETPPLEFDDRPSATLVFANPGYPTKELADRWGKPLRGETLIDTDPNMRAYYAGVSEDGGRLRATGGRVFAVSLLADTRQEAWEQLYEATDGGRAIGIGDGPEDVHFRQDLLNPQV